MTRLAYFPVVEDEDQLIDILSRAAWFLTFSPIDKIYVFVARPGLAETPWRVAPGMDPEIAQRFDALRRMIEFVPASGEADVLPVIEQGGDGAALAPGRESRVAAGGDAFEQRLPNKRVFEIDPHSVRMEGANFIDVPFKLGPAPRALGAENQARFAEVARPTWSL